MREGYLISKLGKIEVENIVKSDKFTGVFIYDEELSKAVKMSIFWLEGDIKRDTETKVSGEFFSLDEIITFGVKYCAEFIDLKLLKEAS